MTGTAVVPARRPGRGPAAWTAYGQLAAYAYCMYGLGPLLTFLREEQGFSYTVMSLHTAVAAAGALLPGLGYSWLCRWLGPRQVPSGAAALLAIGCLCLAVGTATTATLAGVAMLGAGGALLQTCILVRLTELHPTSPARDQVLIEANAGASMAAVLAPLAVGLLAATTLGWRCALLVPIATLAALRITDTTTRQAPTSVPQSAPSSPRRPALTHRYWLLCVMCGGVVGAEFCVVYYGASLLHAADGLSVDAAASAMTLFAVGELVGRLAGSRLVFRSRPGSVGSLITGCLLLSAVAFGLLWAVRSPALAFLALILVGLGMANLFPLTLSLAVAAAPGREDDATARTQLAVGVAVLGAPLLLGALADTAGVLRAFGVGMVLLTVSALLLALARAVSVPTPPPRHGSTAPRQGSQRSTGRPDPTATALEAVRATLETNHRIGVGARAGREYEFTCRSPDSYPSQWAWDNCFHAIALSRTNPEQARAELDSLLHTVGPDGFLPPMALWQDNLRTSASERFRIALWGNWTSVTTAPPVLTRAVERVHEAFGDPEWLARTLPAVLAWFEWLSRHRTDPATGLLVVFQPDESGLDCSPKYDRRLMLRSTPSERVHADWRTAMRSLLDAYGANREPGTDLTAQGRFVWADVLMNTIYANGLARQTAGAPDDARALEERAATVMHALLTHCWDDDRGVFWDLDVLTGQPERVLAVSSLFPLVLPDLPAPLARLVDNYLLNEREFWLPYPVPSVAAIERSFAATFTTGAIFRGSSWINLNWYLHSGLRAHGRDDVAAELTRCTLAMAARSGMRECYGPLDAAGHGARSFGWSTLVLDLAASEGWLP